ncbi:GTP-binding protein [Ruegeria sp. SCPT10]|uniref:GTP-binding protein n=1 Tax=Ruegeria sp. SCP10 TaxID=3141377 RepID=UPI00333CD88C
MARSRSENPSLAIIGHIGHGKTTLAAAISKIRGNGVSYQDISRPSKVKFDFGEYQVASIETTWRGERASLYDCAGHADWVATLVTGAIQVQGAILVVNAADGPMPQTREHIQLAARVGIPKISVFLNKIDQVEDAELLELVEMETRELLSAYEYPGDLLPVVAGSALAALQDREPETGVRSVAALMDAVDFYMPPTGGSNRQSAPTAQLRFEAEAYLLTKEQGGRSGPIFSNFRPLFSIGDKVVPGLVVLPEGTEMVLPGDNQSFEVKLDTPAPMHKFQKFSIFEEGRTIGAGVIANIME